ncbi:unnamed protein product [Kluyveromyces dobzhanskii CBS 2104]|uniref:WGS project CCBQ000000000 data, contig 00012 n=1 Tax=Kluyveromyces dobzhanskii CBS 2104 TaxID=1427455 RepID=A0A0A8L111_9SACH|nr:unnamed protein product [Kluyveromyces dobzhanskii CBS 2104]
MSIGVLDPNYVLVVDYSKENLSVLLAELGAKGLLCESRPGHDAKSVYVFVRDDSGNVLRLVERFPFVTKVSALYTHGERDQLAKTSHELIRNRLLLTDADLVQLAQGTGNPRAAMYFAFVRTYTRFLMALAVFGLGLRLFKPNAAEFNSLYAVVVLMWAISFITLWKNKYEVNYSSQFGYLTQVPLEDSRITFLKKLCFMPIAFLFVVLLLVFQLFCFGLEIFLTQIYNGPFASVVSLLPTVLISVYVPILTLLYNKWFVDRMTAWENGVNADRSKVEKNFVLSFLTSYVPLLITLFVYFPFGHLLNLYLPTIGKYASMVKIPVDTSAFKVNLARYQGQFFYFTVTNQVIALVMENLLPFVLGKVMPIVTGENKPTSDKSRVSKLVDEQFHEEKEFLSNVREYVTGPWGAFNVDDNMRKLVLQFGFVVLFSSIWPLAPLVCVIFNVLFIKLDLWRALVKSAPLVDPKTRKDVVKEDGYEDIKMSPWDSIITFITWFSSLVTPALLLMYRYTNLPGIGYAVSLEKRTVASSWHQYYPFHYDFKTIALSTFLLEHLFIFFYWIVSKTLQSPLTKQSTTFIPAEELKEPPKLNLDHIVGNTVSFMSTLTAPSTSVSKANGERTTAIKQPTEIQPKTVENGYAKTTATNATSSEGNNLKKRGPVSALPLPVVEPPTQTGAPAPSKEISTEQKSSSSTSVSSSVAGATLPPTIPTSKNFHLRNSSPTNDSASVATLSSVPRANAKQIEPQANTETAPAVKESPVAATQQTITSTLPKVEMNLAADAQQFVSTKVTDPEKQFINENKVASTQKQVVPETPAKATKVIAKKDNESIISNTGVSSIKKKKKGIMSPLGKLKKKF